MLRPIISAVKGKPNALKSCLFSPHWVRKVRQRRGGQSWWKKGERGSRFSDFLLVWVVISWSFFCLFAVATITSLVARAMMSFSHAFAHAPFSFRCVSVCISGWLWDWVKVLALWQNKQLSLCMCVCECECLQSHVYVCMCVAVLANTTTAAIWEP